MALIADRQSGFKHYCRVCKKGFVCGRALGGHMRAHGIGDEDEHIDEDEDDHAIDWEGSLAGPNSKKRMYELRANPNRQKACRVCENCGKEFSSWKSFLEHGRCGTDDVESLVSSPGSDEDYDEDNVQARTGCGGNWSKRRRSFRAKVGNCPSSEDVDLANCLMMLSNAMVDPLVAEPEESCASASKEEERRNPLSFAAPVSYKYNRAPAVDKAKGVVPKGMFECKACKKVFTSHQALGGHRASHKKVKGCFAARQDRIDDGLDEDHEALTQEELFPPKSTTSLHFINQGSTSTQLAISPSKRKQRGHECSICHRVFSSGQALGGHKRCHWITSNSPADPSPLPNKFHDEQRPSNDNDPFNDSHEPLDLTLDLNLPASDRVHADPPDVNPSNIGVSTEIYLKPCVDLDAKERDNKLNHMADINNNNNNENNDSPTALMQNFDDEADSKLKLAKLSELKDMNVIGGSSSWLQVGIGTTTNGADGS